MPCRLQKGLDRALEQERKRREKERARFLKEMGFSTTKPDGVEAPKPKKKRAINSTQILARFAEFPTQRARPVLLFQLAELLTLEEGSELQALIDVTSNAPEAKKGETVVKRIGRLPSKPRRPITFAQILERFCKMKVGRPQLVFDMSKCLTPREKRTLQDLIDSAFRARSFDKTTKQTNTIVVNASDDTTVLPSPLFGAETNCDFGST